MAITIDATAGGASANSFVTLAEAETYMEGRGNKTLWTAATDPEKNIALAEATQEIHLCDFLGYPSTSTQALSWPRQWVVDPDSPNYGADYLSSSAVPTRVKNATCELAFQFIKAGTTDVAALDAKANVKRKKVDALETEYFAASNTPTGLARYPRVLAYIRPLLDGYGLTTPVVRG